MRLLRQDRINDFFLHHTSTDKYWYFNPVDNLYGPYLFEENGWEAEGRELDGAALVAPHHLLVWED